MSLIPYLIAILIKISFGNTRFTIVFAGLQMQFIPLNGHTKQGTMQKQGINYTIINYQKLSLPIETYIANYYQHLVA